MRKIKILSLLAFAAFAAVSFNACKDDDGGDDNNSDGVMFTEGDVQYKMSLGELKDNDSELTFTQTYEYIKPFDLKEEIAYTFKYNADSLPQNDSAAQSGKQNYPITDAYMVIECGSEENAQIVRDSLLEGDVANYTITVDGSKLTCTFKNVEGMTYAAVEALYNQYADKISSQRKKNDAAKAKEDAEAKKQEAENNRPTNYNFDRDSVGAIVSTDSTIGFTLVKDGVAAVYSFTFNKNTNMITNGTVICVCKNSDVAKAYAKEHMKDKNANGQLLYKSINLDGCNVTFVYSDSAIIGLTKDAIILAQKNGKCPDVESVLGSAGNNNEEENNEENNGNQQEENNNSQNTENGQNGQNENNDTPVPQIVPEENSNIKPVENEENNNEEPLPHEPIIDNGEGEAVANSIVGRWVASSIKLVGEGVDLSAPVDENDLDYLDFASDGNCSNEWFDEGEKVVDRAVYSINDTVLKFTWNEDNEMDFYYFSLSGDTLILYEYCYYCAETETVYEKRDNVPEHVEVALAQKQYVYKRM